MKNFWDSATSPNNYDLFENKKKEIYIFLKEFVSCYYVLQFSERMREGQNERETNERVC